MVLDYNGCSVLRNTCILITTKHQETLDNSDDRDDELIKVVGEELKSNVYIDDVIQDLGGILACIKDYIENYGKIDFNQLETVIKMKLVYHHIVNKCIDLYNEPQYKSDDTDVSSADDD